MDMFLIHLGASNLINQLLIQEWAAQGHSLSYTFDRSLTYKNLRNGSQYVMAGYAVAYAKIIDEGIEPENISPKMIPGLIQYFRLRGLSNTDAVRAANATYKKWKTEGMSTQASKRFSSTGARHHFVESAFVGGAVKIDDYMTSSFDFAVDEQFGKVKSETI